MANFLGFFSVEFMANVQVFFVDKQKNRQTGQKLCAPDILIHSIRRGNFLLNRLLPDFLFFYIFKRLHIVIKTLDCEVNGSPFTI